ncbi:MAG: hypothetical protein JWN04_4260 [Myxococcaceae bacterium]|nr:hypothetical protein [Myxococcaceae bacterium]
MRSSVETSNLSSADAETSSESTRIECHIDLKAYFHQTLTHALTTRRVEAPATTEFYLVSLLSELGHDAAALSRSLVELSFDLQNAQRSERLARLRNVGDQALSVTGLFDAHLERRGISRTYVEDLGSRAYRTAGVLASKSRELGERAKAEVFLDLGSHFRMYADVLEDVREATVLGTPDDVLALYERFCKTRSPAVAERLMAHGVVAVSASEEVC